MNSSLRTGSFPNQWKHATVIPLHKGGNKLELRNYRPISLLPVPSKLIERVVSNQLTSHLESNQLLYRHQSGFRRLHSTTTTLLYATNVWSQASDNGMCVGVLFLDVAKAFDSVNHSILLGKLPNFGFDQSAIAWFRSYLSGRTQSTAIGDSTSDISNTSLGVPQGCILGPVMPNLAPRGTKTATKMVLPMLNHQRQRELMVRFIVYLYPDVFPKLGRILNPG